MFKKILIAFLAVAGLLEMNAFATSSNTQTNTTPKSLTEVSEYSENIYDLVNTKDWVNANLKFNLLKSAVKEMQVELKGRHKEVFQIETAINELEKAIVSKDSQVSMREANQITLFAANLTALFNPTVPIEVTKMDYYGRELQIWALAKDINKLKTTSKEMRQTWNELRPLVESHGGEVQAKKFEELVIRVEQAQSFADYSQLAKLVLDEVDNLEKVF
jgi:hypothetical protein